MTNIYKKNLIIILLLIIGAVNILQADDWTVWRGPDKNGISKETGWNPEGISKTLWKKDIGAGYSSVVISKGNLFAIGNKDKKDTVYCFDAITGKEKWSFSYPCGKGGGYAGPRATPTIDGRFVYTFSLEGILNCIDIATGKRIWDQNITKFNAENIKWKFSGSPVISGNLIIINAGEHGMAFDKKTGKKAWISTGQGGYSTPLVFGTKTKPMIAIFGLAAINAVDVKTGRKIWSFPWKTKYDVNAADPVITDNGMFISSGYGKGCALLDISGRSPKAKWQNTNMRNHFTSSIFLDGVIYGCDGQTGKGELICLDEKTGNINWKNNLGFGSLIISDGKIIYLNEKGTLTICKVSKTAYSEITTASVLSNAGKCWSVPVLSNGLLYCRASKGSLICLDLRK
jgi:outer membrane protein assembly factor BamB